MKSFKILTAMIVMMILIISFSQNNLYAATTQLSDGIVNVKGYGAVGDGKTDDTIAIQKAVDFAASKGGGIVFLPPGKYIITSTITYTDKIKLRGSGQDVSIINVKFKGVGLEPKNKLNKLTVYPEISYLTIETDHMGSIGLDTSNVIRGDFHHLVVRYFREDNVRIWGEGGARFNGYNVFERLTLSGAPIQMRIVGVANDNVIQNSQFDAYTWGHPQGQRVGIGIMIGNSEDVGKIAHMSNNIKILNNSFENENIGVLVNHGIRFTIAFNRFEAVDTGVLFEKNSRGSSDLHVLLPNYFSVDGSVVTPILDKGTYRLQRLDNTGFQK